MNRQTFFSIVISMAFVGLMVGFSGCSQQPEGPAERAGKAVDEAAGTAGDSMEKAMDNAGDAMKDMGEEVKEGTEEAMESAEKMLGDSKEK